MSDFNLESLLKEVRTAVLSAPNIFEYEETSAEEKKKQKKDTLAYLHEPPRAVLFDSAMIKFDEFSYLQYQHYFALFNSIATFFQLEIKKTRDNGILIYEEFPQINSLDFKKILIAAAYDHENKKTSRVVKRILNANDKETEILFKALCDQNEIFKVFESEVQGIRALLPLTDSTMHIGTAIVPNLSIIDLDRLIYKVIIENHYSPPSEKTRDFTEDLIKRIVSIHDITRKGDLPQDYYVSLMKIYPAAFDFSLKGRIITIYNEIISNPANELKYSGKVGANMLPKDVQSIRLLLSQEELKDWSSTKLYGLDRISATIEEFSKNFREWNSQSEDLQNLLLLGEQDTGKTSKSKEIIASAIEQGYEVFNLGLVDKVKLVDPSDGLRMVKSEEKTDFLTRLLKTKRVMSILREYSRVTDKAVLVYWDEFSEYLQNADEDNAENRIALAEIKSIFGGTEKNYGVMVVGTGNTTPNKLPAPIRTEKRFNCIWFESNLQFKTEVALGYLAEYGFTDIDYDKVHDVIKYFSDSSAATIRKWVKSSKEKGGTTIEDFVEEAIYSRYEFKKEHFAPDILKLKQKIVAAKSTISLLYGRSPLLVSTGTRVGTDTLFTFHTNGQNNGSIYHLISSFLIELTGYASALYNFEEGRFLKDSEYSKLPYSIALKKNAEDLADNLYKQGVTIKNEIPGGDQPAPDKIKLDILKAGINYIIDALKENKDLFEDLENNIMAKKSLLLKDFIEFQEKYKLKGDYALPNQWLYEPSIIVTAGIKFPGT